MNIYKLLETTLHTPKRLIITLLFHCRPKIDCFTALIDRFIDLVYFFTFLLNLFLHPTNRSCQPERMYTRFIGTFIKKSRMYRYSTVTSLKLLMFSLAATVSPALMAEENQPSPPEFIGCVAYTANTGERPIGLYTFSTPSDFAVRIKSLNPTGGAVLASDAYRVTMYSNPAPGIYSVTLLKVEPGTWKRSSGGSTSVAGLYATDMAYDPTTDNIYGCFQNNDASGYVFGYADFNLKKRFAVCDLDAPWAAVSVAKDGTLYAIDSQGVLNKVQKDTGHLERVGVTGVTTAYPTSATIDPETGIMWWTVQAESRKAAMYQVDLSTGKAVKAYDLDHNEQIRGLELNRSLWNEKAPAQVTGLKAEFPEGKKAGTITFTLPVSLIDGSDLTSAVSYKVFANGILLGEGNGTAGQQVSMQTEVSNEGDTRFSVIPFNSNGAGMPASSTLFIGIGTPKTPSPKLAYADGTFSVTWNAVSSTVAGGYFVPADVRYTVVRYPDNKIVASDIAGTSFDDPIAESDRLCLYSYGVTASFSSVRSDEGKTAAYVMGNTIYPAWSYSFENKTVNDFFTLADENKDGATWFQTSSTAGGMGCSGTKDGSKMNDWLITPPIVLSKGYIYPVSVVASAGYASRNSERFAVAFGTEASPQAMADTLIPPTDLTKSTRETYKAYMRPAADGKYYIGILGCSDPGSFRLDISSMSLEKPIDCRTPEAIKELGMTPDESGAPAATFSIRVPDKDIDGNPLSKISGVAIYRNGEILNEFPAPSPGTALSFADSAEKAGLYTYTVVASNEYGDGYPFEKTVFLGINEPANPSEAKVTENPQKPGEVTISWTAVTKDKDGNEMNPELISYRVVRLQSSGQTVVADGVKGTSFTYDALGEGNRQEFVAYGVFAVTKGGESSGVGTETIAIGYPYDAPYHESFAGARAHTNVGILRIAGNPAWKLATETSFTAIQSQDADGGFIAMQGQTVGDSAMVYTGKLDLTGVSRPALTFRTYNIPDETGENKTDINTLDILYDTGNGWVSVKRGTVNDLCNGGTGWQTVTVDLPECAGKVARVAISGCIKLYAFIMIDNIRIGNFMENNLEAYNVTAPETANAGEPVKIAVWIDNAGSIDSGEATLHLLRNNVPVSSTPVPGIKAGDRFSTECSDTLSVVSDKEVTYTARIEYSGDQDESDNCAVSGVLKLLLPSYPVPSALEGTEREDGGVDLRWQAPDAASTLPVTEDFESYPSYANSDIGGWTLVDADGGNIGAIQGIPIPGIDQGSQQSFWIMDSDIREENSTFRAHSGKKYLAQMYVAKNGGAVRCDDWAISPLLSGAEQTVRLYAKTYNQKYPESFKIMYSLSGKELSDFKEAASFTDIPAEWLEYSALLPAGTKYFAIRAVSYDCMMLFIDDITYQPAASGTMQLSGYNVYRDKERINSEVVRGNTYTDVKAVKGNKYMVTALYTDGESAPSNEFLYLATGIETIDAVSGLTYVYESGILGISGLDGMPVAIFDMSGIVRFSAEGKESVAVSLTPGLYVVKAGKESRKLMLR